MKAYMVKGKIRMTNGVQVFRKEFAAENEDHARELVYSLFGSYYKVKRKFIDIEDISEVPAEEIKDPAVRYRVTGE